MFPIVEKIFTIQRHQILKWGRAGGYFGVIFGCLVILGTPLLFFGLHRVGVSKMPTPSEFEQHRAIREDGRKQIERSDDIEYVRAMAIKSLEHGGTMEKRYWSLYDHLIVDPFLVFLGPMVAFGVAYLFAGLLSFRAHELALECERAKSTLGPFSQGDSGVR